MDFIVWVLIIGIGLFLLLIPYFLKTPDSAPAPRTQGQREAEREAAYRRGLLIGGLLEEDSQLHPNDPEHRAERVIVEQTIIEHLQHQREQDRNKES